MKVLFIQKMAGIAGSETYFLSVLPELKKYGVDAEFCCVQHPANSKKNDKFLQNLVASGVVCKIVNTRYPVSLPLLYRLNRIIEQGSYDLVQTNLIHADLWGALIKKFFQPQLKLVSVKHGYDEAFQKQFGFDHTKLKKDWFYRISKFSNKYFQQAAAISEGLAGLLKQGGLINNGKLRVIHYGFDYSAIRLDPQYEKKYRYSSNQLIIVGRLVPVKQHQKVIEILPAVRQSIPDIKLVIVGAGELEQSLKELVGTLGLVGSVSFEGFRSNTHDYIAASDIMLVPSSAEGFGAVILEGWQNKKPVIAFDVPAPNEIIRDKINGLLIKPFDSKELQAGIVGLLHDKVLAGQMGQNGYELLQTQYSLRVMVQKTIDMYNEALGV